MTRDNTSAIVRKIGYFHLLFGTNDPGKKYNYSIKQTKKDNINKTLKTHNNLYPKIPKWEMRNVQWAPVWHINAVSLRVFAEVGLPVGHTGIQWLK